MRSMPMKCLLRGYDMGGLFSEEEARELLESSFPIEAMQM